MSRPPSFVNISWKKTQVDTHTAHSITPPLNMAGKKYTKNYTLIIPRKTPWTGKCWGEIRQVRKVKDVSSQKRKVWKCSGDINSQRRKQILQIDGGVKVRSLYLPLLQNVKKKIKWKKRVFCKCDTLVLRSKRKILQLSHDKSHSFIPKWFLLSIILTWYLLRPRSEYLEDIPWNIPTIPSKSGRMLLFAPFPPFIGLIYYNRPYLWLL